MRGYTGLVEFTRAEALSALTLSGENMKESSLGFWSMLGLMFIMLKLTHVITWSWWLVLLPLYGGLALLLSLLIFSPAFIFLIIFFLGVGNAVIERLKRS
jgi:hypothetical protein